MATKRPNLKEDPPSPASSEEDDDTSSTNDEELPPQHVSDTDSDSDLPPKSSGVLLIASKPQPKAQVHSVPASSSKSTPTTKRASETEREAKDAKRQKEVAEIDMDGDGKKENMPRVLFQWLWGENNDIAVLNGLIEFAERKGFDPLKDMVALYDFIKKSVAVDVSLSNKLQIGLFNILHFDPQI
ncbi:unnamed protein product [Linum trigynum]|uniref:Glabrous enhancer-binding protein-like DBD domain-containing protein n=1 Tax=Linum trigynum TaxID=586398 RepID=A0AAV2EBM5_9ROSI